MSWIKIEKDRNGKDRKVRMINPNWQQDFNNSWINDGADKSLVEFAQSVGEYLAPLSPNDGNALSNSQIRNVFGEIKRLQMKGLTDNENRSSFYLLRAKVAYATGRNKTTGMVMFEKIFHKGWFLVDGDNKKFQNFCNFLEAILAYHRSFGGK